MTENNAEVSDLDSKEQQSQETIGSLISAARLAKKLTIEAVAKELNLRHSIITDIEQDDFSNIASSTYTRGYIKNFARFVEVDPELLAQCIERQLGQGNAPVMQSFSRKTTREATDSRLMWVTYLIVFVLLALFVAWWVQKSNLFTDTPDPSKPSIEETAQIASLEQKKVDQESIETLPLAMEELQTSSSLTHKSDISVDGDNDQPTSALSDELQQQVDADFSLPNEEPMAVSAEVKNIPINETLTEINLTLTGDCWINIQDATGKVIVDGLKESGRIISVAGKAPFKAIFGAPKAIQLTLNGKPVNLDKFPAGRVARMTLPLIE
ncbi:MAG: RodZ domain-containing protein [Parashewanella sp.]